MAHMPHKSYHACKPYDQKLKGATCWAWNHTFELLYGLYDTDALELLYGL